jgi:hypothetical protein
MYGLAVISMALEELLTMMNHASWLDNLLLKRLQLYYRNWITKQT